ncbi:hypothetical protein D3C85_1261790 [compost metagenome]
MAMVTPTTHTCGFVTAAKFGVIRIDLNSSKDFGTGKETKCSFAIANELPVEIKTSFKTIPAITAISAPGTNFNFFKKGTFSQAINITNETNEITTAPKWM